MTVINVFFLWNPILAVSSSNSSYFGELFFLPYWDNLKYGFFFSEIGNISSGTAHSAALISAERLLRSLRFAPGPEGRKAEITSQ